MAVQMGGLKWRGSNGRGSNAIDLASGRTLDGLIPRAGPTEGRGMPGFDAFRNFLELSLQELLRCPTT